MYGPRLGDDECQCRRLEPTLDRGPGVLPLHSHRGEHAVPVVRRHLASARPCFHDPMLFRPGEHRMRLTAKGRRSRGQALMEFALVFPMFMFLLMAVIVFGLFVFYNQQLENAAREAARYAAVHSSSAQCPTVSRLDPGGPNKANSYFRCD